MKIITARERRRAELIEKCSSSGCIPSMDPIKDPADRRRKISPGKVWGVMHYPCRNCGRMCLVTVR